MLNVLCCVLRKGCQSTVICDVALAFDWLLEGDGDGTGELDGESDNLSAATCCVSVFTSVTMYWY
jgi:hypothetical protein